MKKMNRLFTLALALIMILSVAAPAFAADPDPLSDEHSHTVTIDNHRTGYEYTAYQIFKGKLSSTGILSDMAWGESITNPEALLAALAATDAFAGVTSVSDVAAKLSSATAAIDDPIAMAFASVAGQYIETNDIAGFRSSSYNDSIQKYEISNLPDGYYLIMNTGLPQDDPETPDVDESANTTYSRYILEVVRDVTVSHKGDFPKVEKHIHNILFVTGDPPKLGNFPASSGVFDVDAIGMTEMQKRLNQGIDLGGGSLKMQTSAVIGVGLDPNAIDQEREYRRICQKAEAGADFIVTQPVFDPEKLLSFLQKIEHLHLPVIAGVWPLASLRNAEFMRTEVPGVVVPDSIMQRMGSKIDKDAQKAEGIAIARECIGIIKPHVAGVQVSAPFGNVHTALAVLD